MNVAVPINNERQPVVFARDGEAFANSRDVAAYFGKEHRNVMQAVDNLIAQDPDLARAEFSAGVYTLPNTGAQQHRMFEMNRDGFVLLAMGFTGTKALKWKRQYIAAFNALEAECRRIAQGGPAIDLNDPAQLRNLLLNYSERAEALEQRVQELLPEAEALDRISKADGSLNITEAAKALQIRPKDLFDYLAQHGWTYKRAGASNWLGYQSKTMAGLLEHKVTTVLRADGSEKVTEQVRVTPKGLTKLAKLIQPGLR